MLSKKKYILFVLLITFLCVAYFLYNSEEYLDENKYKDAKGQAYSGYWSIPKNFTEELPGVLLIHEWTGLGEYIKMRTRQIASEGYIAFAIDLYGVGKRAENHQEAKVLMKLALSNQDSIRNNIIQSLDLLKNSPYVRSDRLAAIGYCFGGDRVLDISLMDRTDVHALVSFYGMLDFPDLEKRMENINMSAGLMIHHGEKDPFVSKEIIKSFHSVLGKYNVPYQFFVYPDSYHAFTRKGAGKDEMKDIVGAVLYNKRADKKSWKRTIDFLSKKLKY